MLKKILCAATLLCAASFTNAATISYTQSIVMTPTNWDTTLSLQQFNPNFGTLTKVTFTVDGSVSGDAKAENEDNVAQTVNLSLSAVETLMHGTDTLVVTIPLIISPQALAAYDSVTDFMGPSGVSLLGISASQSESEEYTTAALLAAFTGFGTEDVTLDAAAASIASGPGNITSSFRTSASAMVTVTYEYDDLAVGIPTPSSIAFLGLGILAFAGLRKVRK